MKDANNKPTNPASQEPSNDQERIRVFLIGSPKAIAFKIHALSRIGFAAVTEWSQLVPAHRPGLMMSVLTRFIPKQ